MNRLGVMALVLAGCVEDAVVVRVPSSDSEVTPSLDASRSDREYPTTGDPVLHIEITATGEDNAAVRSAFAVDIEIFATSNGVPADPRSTLTRNGGLVPLLMSGPGRFGASLDDYPVALALMVRSTDGTRRDVELSLLPIFNFLAPRLHERFPSDSPIPVTWSPTGGATTTLLAPGGRRVVAETGRLTLSPGVFSTDGVHLVRLQRSITVAPAALPAGSTLTVKIVNSVEVEIE